MTFKILNGEEVALLDEEQKTLYEYELNIYQERVAFVEQLEAYENILLPSYKPLLKDIIMIDTIGLKPYCSPVYEKLKLNTIKKLDTNIKPYAKIAQTKVKMPCIHTPKLNIHYVKDVIEIQPELPKVMKPNIADLKFERPITFRPKLPKTIAPLKTKMHFKKIQQQKVDLPFIKTPDIEMFSHIRPVIEDTCVPKNIPNVAKINTNIQTYTPPIIKKTDLPVLAKCEVQIRTYEKFKHSQKLQLPTLTKPELHIKSYQFQEIVKPVLPTVLTCSYNDTFHFKGLEQRDISLPVIEVAKLATPAFKTKPIEKNALPKIQITEIKLKHFEKNTSINLRLPDIVVSSSEIHPFTKPELRMAKLPKSKEEKALDAPSLIKAFQSILHEKKTIMKG